MRKEGKEKNKGKEEQEVRRGRLENGGQGR